VSPSPVVGKPPLEAKAGERSGKRGPRGRKRKQEGRGGACALEGEGLKETLLPNRGKKSSKQRPHQCRGDNRIDGPEKEKKI